MTFIETHSDNEFNNDELETMIDYIKTQILMGHMGLEQIHDLCQIYTYGVDKKPISKEIFFLAYKAAEILAKDIIEFKEARSKRQTFRRSE